MTREKMGRLFRMALVWLLIASLLGIANRIQAAGVVDGFNPTIDASPYYLILQSDGNILFKGKDNNASSPFHMLIGRLNSDGSQDTSFNWSSNYSEFESKGFALQTDGNILFNADISGVLGRLYPDGTQDTAFNPNLGKFKPWLEAIQAVLVQPDGKIVIAGEFNRVGDTYTYGLARLNPDGSLDGTYENTSTTRILALQSDGKLISGGVDGALKRYFPDGTQDTGFYPNTDASVIAIAVLPNGKILLGGSFTQVNGQSHPYLVRLNPEGTLDTSFYTTVSAAVSTIAVQADGKILIGGSFAKVNGIDRAYLAMLNPDGSLVTSYNPAPNGMVGILSIQPDGKVIVNGSFTELGGQPRNNMGRLNSPYPAVQTLLIAESGDTITWQRSGSAPEIDWAVFEASVDGGAYQMLGTAHRVSGGWQLGGLRLPYHQDLSIRARGLHSVAGSGGILEQVQNVYLEPPYQFFIPITFR